MTGKLEKKKKLLAALALEVKTLERQQSKKQKDVETRRLVLIGAMISGQAKKNPDFDASLKKDLEKFLIRPDERALFGFPPLAEETKAK